MNLDAFIYHHSELFSDSLDESKIRSRIDSLSYLEWQELLTDASRRCRKEMSQVLCEEILAMPAKSIPKRNRNEAEPHGRATHRHRKLRIPHCHHHLSPDTHGR
jgi:hypothetical protein